MKKRRIVGKRRADVWSRNQAAGCFCSITTSYTPHTVHSPVCVCVCLYKDAGILIGPVCVRLAAVPHLSSPTQRLKTNAAALITNTESPIDTQGPPGAHRT